MGIVRAERRFNGAEARGDTLTYNAWNQIVSVSNYSGVIQSYKYDALQRRIYDSGYNQNLYYDAGGAAGAAGGNVIEERSPAAVTAQYVWGLGYANNLVLRDDNYFSSGSLGAGGSGLGERLYAQQDADWNVTSLTDASGAVQRRYVYNLYGTAYDLAADWSYLGSLSADGYVFWIYTYQGGRQDLISGLVNFGLRDYNAGEMRWMQADPAGYVNGADVYQFELSDPVNGLDPMGLAVSDPGWWSLVPVVGPLWDAGYQYDNGHWIKGTGDLGLAAWDATGIGGAAHAAGGALLKGGLKAAGKLAAKKAAQVALEDGAKAAEKALAEAAAKATAEAAGKATCEAAGKGAATELHHLLPQSKRLKPLFEKAGLNIEDYKIPLDKALHRLKPDGIHTGPFEESWNGAWEQFFNDYPNANKDAILTQLAKMRKDFGI